MICDLQNVKVVQGKLLDNDLVINSKSELIAILFLMNVAQVRQKYSVDEVFLIYSIQISFKDLYTSSINPNFNINLTCLIFS